MSIISYATIGYFFIGIVLAYIWWKDEYESEYELAKEQEEEVEEPMAVLLIVCLAVFWPFKAIKNYFESFLD